VQQSQIGCAGSRRRWLAGDCRGQTARHYDTWRIRWTDETGNFEARHVPNAGPLLALGKVEIEVEEQTGPSPPGKRARRFAEGAEYWRQHRAPLELSEKDDLSIFEQLEAHFGKLLLNDTPSWVPAIDSYRDGDPTGQEPSAISWCSSEPEEPGDNCREGGTFLRFGKGQCHPRATPAQGQWDEVTRGRTVIRVEHA
jgi:hypothetical protein